MTKTALLLIAHGSRQAEANADLQHLAAEIRSRDTFAIVEPAFLELAEPTISQGAARCVEQGADRVILLPYFLSAGVHVRRDLQDHCRRLGGQSPPVSFQVAEPLGRHPLLVEVVVARAREAEKIAKPAGEFSSLWDAGETINSSSIPARKPPPHP